VYNRSDLERRGAKVRSDGYNLILEGALPLPAAADRTYYNPSGGYALRVPEGWRLDFSAYPATVRLVHAEGQIRLFDERLDPQTSVRDYEVYGARSVLLQWGEIRLHQELRARVAGRPAYVLAWSRPALPLPRDENLYWEYDIERGPHRVLTVYAKATEAGWQAVHAGMEAVLASLTWQPEVAAPDWLEPVPAPGDLPDASGLFGGRRIWGVFHPVLQPLQPDWQALAAAEEALGFRWPLLMTYQHVGDPFPTDFVRTAASQGREILLTLQFWEPADPLSVYRRSSTLVFRLLRGEFDPWLRAYARAARDSGVRFLLRVDNEMNGDWSPWSAWHFGKDTDLYVAAWRHVREVFRAEGAGNVLWVWNPNDRSYPPFAWNHSRLYYPGDDAVDVVGMTGYNAGSSYPGDRWRGFFAIYDPLYAEYRRLYPRKPLIVGEFASNETGGDKAAWVDEAFRRLQEGFPAVRAFVWWHGVDGRRDYRYDSSPAVLDVFRRRLAGWREGP
ncbi:MAG: hypothetical protein IRY95_05125, partial [Clostridia bacterium]|nr:hypothetical protein [Clostridia bacterium]